jgi:hypothetical protein
MVRAREPMIAKPDAPPHDVPPATGPLASGEAQSTAGPLVGGGGPVASPPQGFLLELLLGTLSAFAPMSIDSTLAAFGTLALAAVLARLPETLSPGKRRPGLQLAGEARVTAGEARVTAGEACGTRQEPRGTSHTPFGVSRTPFGVSRTPLAVSRTPLLAQSRWAPSSSAVRAKVRPWLP